MRGAKLAVLIGAVVVCIVALVVMVGCDTFGGVPGGGGNGGGGGANVPLGNMRIIQPGDTWNYRFTGTIVPPGGAVGQITPSDVTFVYSVGTVAVGGTPDAHTATFTAPIAYPGGGADFMEVVTVAVKQAANGIISMHGISPCDTCGMGALTNATGSIELPDFTDGPSIDGWLGQSPTDGYGDFWMDMHYEGVENVLAGDGNTYACHKISGQKHLGGFTSDYVMWGNPGIAAFVRRVDSWVDVGGTHTWEFMLQGKNF